MYRKTNHLKIIFLHFQKTLIVVKSNRVFDLEVVLVFLWDPPRKHVFLIFKGVVCVLKGLCI